MCVCVRVPSRQATALHFDDLRMRYGSPIVCLNLLKSSERRPRETLLRREMGIAIAMLNRRVSTQHTHTHMHTHMHTYMRRVHAQGQITEG